MGAVRVCPVARTTEKVRREKREGVAAQKKTQKASRYLRTCAATEGERAQDSTLIVD